MAECRQGNFTQDANSIVVIRSEGTASDNRTKVAIEVTMSPNTNATLVSPKNRLGLPCGRSRRRRQLLCATRHHGLR